MTRRIHYIEFMDDIANDISSTIGKRIHAERSMRGWSLAELADRSGVSKAMLSTIERGKTSPTAALLVRIASAFGMDSLADGRGKIVRYIVHKSDILKSPDREKRHSIELSGMP